MSHSVKTLSKAIRKAGFTLVEIMIVVTIIGFLAALGIPSFIRARTTTQKNACIDNLRIISGGKEQWAIENYAATGDPCLPTDVSPYLKKGFPKCPAGGAYDVKNVGEDPVCDRPGHTL